MFSVLAMTLYCIFIVSHSKKIEMKDRRKRSLTFISISLIFGIGVTLVTYFANTKDIDALKYTAAGLNFFLVIVGICLCIYLMKIFSKKEIRVSKDLIHDTLLRNILTGGFLILRSSILVRPLV